MSGYAKLRTDLISSSSIVDNITVFTVKDPRTDNYFRMREPEFRLINQLDGRTSEEAIAANLREEFGIDIGGDDVKQFVAAMDQLLFLENSRSEQALSRASYSASRQRSLLDRILYIKLKGFAPGRLLDSLVRWYRPFHRPFWLGLAGLGILLGLVLLFANARYFQINLLELWAPESLVLLVLSLLILVTIHEFAHAMVCRLYGGEVKEIGFLLMYFQPCFYCDLSDAWLFEKKSQRLAVTIAGPFFQLILLAGSVLLWRVSVTGSFVNDLAWMLVTVNWLNFLFNFNPLIKLDGYYLLSDWLDIANLRQKAFGYIRNLLKRRLLGWPEPVPEITRRERRVFIGYGVTALVYSSLLLGYLFWLAAGFLLAKFGPVGLILFFAALLFTFRSILKEFGKGIARHIKHMRHLFKKPIRLASYLVLFSVVVILAVVVPLPQRVSGNVMVRPVAEFTLSLNNLGLVESLTRFGGANPASKSSFLQMTSSDMAALNLQSVVKDGQSVSRGDTVAVITSNQITRDIEEARAELERLKGKLALLKAPPKKEEIAEANARVTSAQALLDQVERERRLIEELLKSNGETVEHLEASRSQVAIASADLAKAVSAAELLSAPPRPEEEALIRHEIKKQQAQLDFLGEQAQAQHIIAPINGVILTGQKSNLILSVSDCRTVELIVPVSDFDIPLIQMGQPVQVKVRAYPDRVFLGTVVRVSDVADEFVDGMFFPIAILVDNNEGLLRDGMSGYAKIETGESSLVSLGMRKMLSLLKIEFWSWW